MLQIHNKTPKHSATTSIQLGRVIINKVAIKIGLRINK